MAYTGARLTMQQIASTRQLSWVVGNSLPTANIPKNPIPSESASPTIIAGSFLGTAWIFGIKMNRTANAASAKPPVACNTHTGGFP